MHNKVFGYGDANQGQLGLGGDMKDRVMQPTLIVGLSNMHIREVACGKYHALFLTESGDNRRRELWACGANNFGQIGNNSN